MLKLALIAGLLALVVFAALPHTMRFFHLLQKLAHPVVFGAIALLVLALLRPTWRRSTCQLYLAALLITVALGAATELLQFFTHRDPSVLDVLRDSLGAVTALAAWATGIAPRPTAKPAWPPRLAALAVALAGACVMLKPITIGLLAYGHRDLSYPVLAAFDSPLDQYFVSALGTHATGAAGAGLRRVAQPERWARAPGEQALSVPLAPGPWAGVSLDEPYPNWRGREALLVDLTNTAPTDLEISVRVHDRAHVYRYEDRYNGSWPLPGATRTVLRIALRDIEAAPRGRRMDLEHIAGVMIFLPGSPANPPALLVNRVWLE